MVLSFLKASESGQGLTKVKINCDNMELVADIMQDLAKYMKWDELDSEADFPAEFEKFEEVSQLEPPRLFDRFILRMLLSAPLVGIEDSCRVQHSAYQLDCRHGR